MPPIFSRFVLCAALGTSLVLSGCNPTVKIEAPDKPIEINLNVKIEQEVRVRVERDLDELLAENPDLF
jgi:outer membrane murein-binding lipoprotein Lpp